VSGTLLLAGAPLGNPEDASPRLRAALADADVVAAETPSIAHLSTRSGGAPGAGDVVLRRQRTGRTPELLRS